MPDFPTGLPEAGWFTDPANPALERWWGGLEWTQTTRDAPARATQPSSAPQPAFAGSFPAAAVPALSFPTPGAASAPAAANGFSPLPSPDEFVPTSREVGLGGWVPATPVPGVSELALVSGYGTATPEIAAPSVAASWYTSANKFLGPPPTNGVATAGLIFSLIGFVLFGLVFSISGLVKAARFQKEGFAPIGRRRAGWGLALSILTVVALPLALVFAYPQIQEQINLLTEQQQQVSQNTPLDEDAPIPLTGTYDRAMWEQSITAGFVQTGQAAPESVTCPESATYAAGTTISCTILWGGATFLSTTTITDDLGNNTTTVVQQ